MIFIILVFKIYYTVLLKKKKKIYRLLNSSNLSKDKFEEFNNNLIWKVVSLDFDKSQLLQQYKSQL